MARNIVFVILDTVRKDYFDTYASDIATVSDTSFEQCRAASSWSVPSHASILTGDLSHQHGIHRETFGTDESFESLSASDTFLSELPKHSTLGISANSYVNSLYGFDLLFDDFEDIITHSSFFPEALSPYEFEQRNGGGDGWSSAPAYVRTALTEPYPIKSLLNGLWPVYDSFPVSLPMAGLTDDGASSMANLAVKKSRSVSEPYFLFMNFMDAHVPFRNLSQYDQSLHSVPNQWSSAELNQWEINKEGVRDEDYLSNYRELYSASIDYLASVVIDMIRTIRQETQMETTVIVTSDHGHNLGYPADGDLIHHNASMSEGVLHTPLEIVNPPEGYPETVSQFFSHLGFGEMIVSLAKGDVHLSDNLFRDYVPSELIGLGGTGDPRNYREFTDEEFAYWNRMIRVVYDGEMKYEWDSTGRSRTLILDPERPCWQDVRGNDEAFPEFVFDRFKLPLDEYNRQFEMIDAEADTPDEIPRDRLKELGYL